MRLAAQEDDVGEAAASNVVVLENREVWRKGREGIFDGLSGGGAGHAGDKAGGELLWGGRGIRCRGMLGSQDSSQNGLAKGPWGRISEGLTW